MMKRPKVLTTRELPQPVSEVLEEKYDFSVLDKGIDLRCGLPKDASALICSPSDSLTEEVIESLPKSIKIISTYSVGTDHIDLKATKTRKIFVSNTPDVLTATTAELAVYLILAVQRKTRRYELELRSEEWRGWEPTHALSPGLEGKTVGLLGFGRIAQATARRLLPFGCRLHIWNRSQPRIPDDLQSVVLEPSTNELAEVSDVLSLHIPGGADTDGVISKKLINSMKPGSALVNTARGSLLDDDAVCAALDVGQISAVGLDVHKNEPEFDRRYLKYADNVLLPHIGSATESARVKMGECVARSVSQALSGEQPDFLVSV